MSLLGRRAFVAAALSLPGLSSLSKKEELTQKAFLKAAGSVGFAEETVKQEFDQEYSFYSMVEALAGPLPERDFSANENILACYSEKKSWSRSFKLHASKEKESKSREQRRILQARRKQLTELAKQFGIKLS
jgi:hypothetical protein